MEYYSILNLAREPFSNSPDPSFFYPSGQHRGCLQQLELAIRLRRGLNVVIGDVGTGKTTLCRDLIRRFADEATMDAHLMLDPAAASDTAFLAAVSALLTGAPPPENASRDGMKESIKQFLFDKGVAERRTLVLIIDEGQKLAPSSLEVLREFLNYETNDHKLLQIVIFAQKEFTLTLRDHPNFADRINLRFDLDPLGFRDTMGLIRHRLHISGGGPATRLFSLPAMAAIYLSTRGYPRKIIHLCHRSLLALIIQNSGRAGWRLVRASARRTNVYRSARPWRWTAAVVMVMVAALSVAALSGGFHRAAVESAPSAPVAASSEKKPPPATLSAMPESQAPEIAPPSPRNDDGSASRAQGTENAPVPPGSAAPAIASVAMPARLGRLSIAPEDTLGRLIQMIYGRFTPAYLEAIAEANPHIPNPDALQVGDVIHFPALPTAVRPMPVNVWWVALSEHRRLDRAVAELKRLKRKMIPARLVPFWNPEQGMMFTLVQTDCYFDHHAAQTALARCGAAAGSGAAVRSLWRDDTVYFSDPFQGTDWVPDHP